MIDQKLNDLLKNPDLLIPTHHAHVINTPEGAALGWHLSSYFTGGYNCSLYQLLSGDAYIILAPSIDLTTRSATVTRRLIPFDTLKAIKAGAVIHEHHNLIVALIRIAEHRHGVTIPAFEEEDYPTPHTAPPWLRTTSDEGEVEVTRYYITDKGREALLDDEDEGELDLRAYLVGRIATLDERQVVTLARVIDAMGGIK